jgi:hypothetical protein
MRAPERNAVRTLESVPISMAHHFDQFFLTGALVVINQVRNLPPKWASSHSTGAANPKTMVVGFIQLSRHSG